MKENIQNKFKTMWIAHNGLIRPVDAATFINRSKQTINTHIRNENLNPIKINGITYLSIKELSELKTDDSKQEAASKRKNPKNL